MTTKLTTILLAATFSLSIPSIASAQNNQTAIISSAVDHTIRPFKISIPQAKYHRDGIYTFWAIIPKVLFR